MVNSVLHTYKIIKRPHRPEVIRTLPPTNMPDRGSACIGGHLNVTKLYVTISDSDKTINLKFTCLVIVIVTIELKKLYILAHVIFIEATIAVYLILHSLIEILRLSTTSKEITNI